MTELRHHPLRESEPEPGRHDLVRAWAATGLVVLMLVLMPAVPALLAGAGLGLEDASFLGSVGVLAGFVLVLDTLAATAVLSARRARDAGFETASLPLVVSAGIAALMTGLLVVTVAAHLLGFE